MAAGVPHERLAVTLAEHGPDVAMIGFGDRLPGQEHRVRDILHAIYLASRGLHVLPAAGVQAYEPSGPAPLTAREADVRELLQGGQSNAEIAASLHVAWRRSGPTRATSTASPGSAPGANFVRRPSRSRPPGRG